ncbi:hypothetical protein NP493_2004g00000 [Ridgeia piscesae]|uniref:TGF-beta family profile domain-containing protein n=1 Tax=Ridgeia piscesae TaxID=27915 RepID=A0AAD9N3S1_RIDPI|nr:hypothetical protein NP493_2004g00000 [Ridgeia piscesae]
MVLVRCGRRRCRPRKVRRGGRRWTPASITLKIYNMLNTTGSDDGGLLITSLKVGVRRTKWMKLIVPTSVIQEVVDSPTRVLPMRIACENCTKSVRPVAVRKARRKKNRKSRRDVDTVEKTMRQRQKSAARRERRMRKQRAKAGGKVRKKKQPYLVIFTRRVDTSPTVVGRTMRMSEHIRRRRHLDRRSDVVTSSSVRTCRKRSMYVSFRQLGLDNMISWPVGFLTSYCEEGGAAPVGRSSHHRRHRANLLAHIKYNRSKANTAAGSPCRPTETAPLSVVYYADKTNIAEVSIPGLIVTRCGGVV